jgi:hypothetical protein
MRPVDQTTFGHPGGNCFSACVASLLELRIGEVPYFMDESGGRPKWFQQLDTWLAPFCLYALHFSVTPEHAELYDKQDLWPKGYFILNGRSPRGDHAVIARGSGVAAFDPHPSRDGLASVDGYVLLVPTYGAETAPQPKWLVRNASAPGEAGEASVEGQGPSAAPILPALPTGER